ncbi:MAG TPA: hypothetical protein VJ140_19625 [Actinomycetota bacterium]|nr:hypothetical protein [Actinomycetota bacterium]
MGDISRNRAYNPREVREEINDNDSRITALEALAVANEVGAGTIDTEHIAAAALAADADGRAIMADDYFDAATVLAKFDADSFDNAQLLLAVKDGAFADSSATRALFADGWMTGAKLAAATVTADKLAAAVSGLSQSLSGAGAINLTTPVTRYTSTGAAQALTLADGSINGQKKTIIHVVDGGSGVLTAGGSLHLGNSLATITLANLWDWVELTWETDAWYVTRWAGAGVAFA